MKTSFIAYLQAHAGPYALLVSGSPRGTDAELIAQLAEDADFILAADFGAEVLAAAGVTTDLLLGDFDSIDPLVFDQLQAKGVETVAFAVCKDATDIELAVDELLKRGYYSIIATNVSGGRVDHALGSLATLTAATRKRASVIVIEETEIFLFLTGSGPIDSFSLDTTAVVAPTYISLIPWGGEATVSVTGVKWELDHAVLTPYSTLGVSNEPCGDCIDLKVFDGSVIAVLQTVA